MQYTTDRDIYRHCNAPDPILFLENNGWRCFGMKSGERMWKCPRASYRTYSRSTGITTVHPAGWTIKTEAEAIEMEQPDPDFLKGGKDYDRG